jgi:hypothetical protein
VPVEKSMPAEIWPSFAYSSGHLRWPNRLKVRTTRFLDFIHRPVFYRLENTFRKLELLPSSGEGGDTYSSSLFFRLGGGRVPHNVQSPIFRVLKEDPAIRIAISNRRVCLKVVLTFPLLRSRSCSLGLGFFCRCCISGRSLWRRALFGAGTASRINRLRAAASLCRDSPSLWVRPRHLTACRRSPDMSSVAPVVPSRVAPVLRMRRYIRCLLWGSLLPLQTGLRRSYTEAHQGLTQVRVRSYVTTDGQSASLSWNKALIWSWRQDLYYCQTVSVCWCGALSLTRGRVGRLPVTVSGNKSVVSMYTLHLTSY